MWDSGDLDTRGANFVVLTDTGVDEEHEIGCLADDESTVLHYRVRNDQSGNTDFYVRIITAGVLAPHDLRYRVYG
jgi:hypothetical protein